MPRSCTVCTHSERGKMDSALIDGQPLRNIAKHFRVSVAALHRHKTHVSETLKRSREVAEVARADSLMEQLSRLAEDARRIKAKAEKARDYRTALAGVRELTRLVELAARLTEDALPLDRAMALFTALTEAVRQNVHDRVALARISEAFARLTGHGPLAEADTSLVAR